MQNSQAGGVSTKKPTILLADGDAAMLELLSRVLEIEGCRVVTAGDSATVLKLAAGAIDYMVKPLSASSLKKAVAHILRPKRRR